MGKRTPSKSKVALKSGSLSSSSIDSKNVIFLVLYCLEKFEISYQKLLIIDSSLEIKGPSEERSFANS